VIRLRGSIAVEHKLARLGANAGMFGLASAYAEEGMSAYVRLQDHEFLLEHDGYTATKHQHEVGTGYFDLVSRAVSQGGTSTLALVGSTEQEQFEDPEDASLEEVAG
jgi:isocitrate/methylisocitrate lyase